MQLLIHTKDRINPAIITKRRAYNRTYILPTLKPNLTTDINCWSTCIPKELKILLLIFSKPCVQFTFLSFKRLFQHNFSIRVFWSSIKFQSQKSFLLKIMTVQMHAEFVILLERTLVYQTVFKNSFALIHFSFFQDLVTTQLFHPRFSVFNQISFSKVFFMKNYDR